MAYGVKVVPDGALGEVHWAMCRLRDRVVFIVERSAAADPQALANALAASRNLDDEPSQRALRSAV